MGKLNVQLGVPSQHQETGPQVGQLARAGQGGEWNNSPWSTQIKTPSPSNLHRSLGDKSKRKKENNSWQWLGLGCDAMDLTFSSLQFFLPSFLYFPYFRIFICNLKLHWFAYFIQMCACARACPGTHVEVRTSFMSLFYPSSMWISGSHSALSGLAAGVFPHWSSSRTSPGF